MALRRMVHSDVICCDAFLDLDFESQALFFQLQIKADEYGFVQSPRSTLRMMGASAESLEALIRSGFVIRFHSGIIVMTHWNMANTRRADREAKIRFPEEYSRLQVDKTGVYSMRDDNGMTAGTQWDDSGMFSISSSLSHSVSPSLNPAEAEAVDASSASSSASGTASVRGNARARVREGESPDDDTDQAAEDNVTYEEYFERTFPRLLKKLLGWWTGFREISVREIREYLSKGISPELLLWAASHAVDAGAASPRSYLRCVLEDKQEIDAVTLARLLEVEGDDQRERESIWRIAKKVSELREQIREDWETQQENKEV